MKKAKFRQELQQLLPLVLSYGSDYFKLTKYKNPKDALRSINKREFINKCHEGFKMAQEKIINNLFYIEKEIKVARENIKKYKEGKHAAQFKKDKKYNNLIEYLNNLKFQDASIREVANTIVWTIFKNERTHIKSFIQENMMQGYLKDKNIGSSIKIATKINKKKDQFALITDITSCLGVGDIIWIDYKGKKNIVEVKEGKINDLILKLFHVQQLDKETAEKVLDDIIISTGEKGIKQIERFFRQDFRMRSILQYMKTDEGIDFITGRIKKAIYVPTPDKDFYEEIYFAIQEVYSRGKDYFILPFDCGYVGIFRKEIHRSEFAYKMDFKHYLYHETKKDWEECDYTKDPSLLNYSKDNPPELFIYGDIPIFSLKEKVFYPTHQPLFFTLAPEHAIDLLADKIAIYIYFDEKKFCKICEEKGIIHYWLYKQRDIDKKLGDTRLSAPNFDGKYLVLKYKNVESPFYYGELFRIIFEFKYASNVVDQIKEYFENLSRG